MQSVMQEKPIHVVGLEIRTSNANASTDIPAHWKKFFESGILEKIPNKVSGDLYAVYTNFENPGKNNQGIYSFIIGAEIRDPSLPIPEGFVETVIPASKRWVFEVPTGRPDKVGEKWQEIWALGDSGKAFISDFEHYKENGEIEIHVGTVND